MICFRSALTVAMLFAVASTAEVSSPKYPKKTDAMESTKKDNSLQEIKGKKVDLPAISEASSDVKSPKSETHPPTDNLQRQMMEIRTTLENVDIDYLDPVEVMFYEGCFQKAVEIAQSQADSDKQVSVRSVIVERDHNDQKKHNRRGLRGGEKRALWSWNPWYDIWALMEVFSCRFCGYDDDDDFFDSVADYPTYSLFDDDDDYDSLIPMRDIDYGWHRALGVSESFADILCDLLRDGPHERFHGVTKCSIEFAKW
eukprot:scaffold1669_cov129-Cylindrotheca_fusiformis.AAC.9